MIYRYILQTYAFVKELSAGKGAVFGLLYRNGRMWIASERALQVYDAETLGLLKEHPFASFHISCKGDNNTIYVAVWEGVKIFDESVRLDLVSGCSFLSIYLSIYSYAYHCVSPLVSDYGRSRVV